jgi:hypothetical protein
MGQLGSQHWDHQPETSLPQEEFFLVVSVQVAQPEEPPFAGGAAGALSAKLPRFVGFIRVTLC